MVILHKETSKQSFAPLQLRKVILSMILLWHLKKNERKASTDLLTSFQTQPCYYRVVFFLVNAYSHKCPLSLNDCLYLYVFTEGMMEGLILNDCPTVTIFYEGLCCQL